MRVRLFLIYFQLLIQADFAALDHLDLGAAERNLVLDALVFDLVTIQDLTLLLMVLVLILFADTTTVKPAATARRSDLVRGTWLVSNLGHQLE